MREKINRLRHLGVLFLTLIIFFLGVFIGGNVEDLRVESLYNQLQEQDLDYQNIATESSYIDFLISQNEQNGSLASCNTIESAYFNSINNLDLSRKKLESYLGTSTNNEDEFNRLKGHYANAQVNYLMLAQKISSLCDEKLNVIVYFYADDDTCPSCEDQGVYLTYVKQRLQEDVLVFSFDVNREGPVQLLKTHYNITTKKGLPVLIVNGEELDFSTSDEILNVLCEQGLNDSTCN